MDIERYISLLRCWYTLKHTIWLSANKYAKKPDTLLNLWTKHCQNFSSLGGLWLEEIGIRYDICIPVTTTSDLWTMTGCCVIWLSSDGRCPCLPTKIEHIAIIENQSEAIISLCHLCDLARDLATAICNHQNVAYWLVFCDKITDLAQDTATLQFPSLLHVLKNILLQSLFYIQPWGHVWVCGEKCIKWRYLLPPFRQLHCQNMKTKFTKIPPIWDDHRQR